MTQFDGSSGHAASAAVLPAAPQFDSGLDALTLLKETVADRIEITEHIVTVPGGRIRLVCSTDVPEKSLRRWQKASLPLTMRKSANVTALDSDQMTVAVAALVYTTLRIEVLGKDNETWHPVEDKSTGDPLALDHEAVLRLFNVIDTHSALVRIFGRESDVIRASQEVLAAAGWTGENGGDDDDPR